MIKTLLEKSPVKVSVEPVSADEQLRYQSRVECPAAPAQPENAPVAPAAEEKKINIVWPLACVLGCQVVLLCVLVARWKK